MNVIITCEHGGNRVPAAYRQLFSNCRRVLDSHRGWDRGALELARTIAQRVQAPLIHADVTRLLVDLNRSLGNKSLFSRYTMPLPLEERQRILERHYVPYREQVENAVATALKGSQVVHFSIHTFTPVLRGLARNADIGMLYDPRRLGERQLCAAWHRQLLQTRPELRVRRNYPYTGISDGFTTFLRRRFGDAYLGIELEANQRWPRSRPTTWRKLQSDIADSLRVVLDYFA